MDEYPIVPKPYPLCMHCAILASIAFLYFNLTQWTQGSRKGRYSAFLFSCPAFRFPCADIHSPLHPILLARFAPSWRAWRFCIFNNAKNRKGFRNGRYSAFRFSCPNVLWANINSPLPYDKTFHIGFCDAIRT